jgi:hypothetical protein
LPPIVEKRKHREKQIPDKKNGFYIKLHRKSRRYKLIEPDKAANITKNEGSLPQTAEDRESTQEIAEDRSAFAFARS